MSRAILRKENEELRKQLTASRAGYRESEEVLRDRDWRIAGEEMCKHVGIKPTSESFVKWMRSRYEKVEPYPAPYPATPTIRTMPIDPGQFQTYAQMLDAVAQANIQAMPIPQVEAVGYDTPNTFTVADGAVAGWNFAYGTGTVAARNQ